MRETVLVHCTFLHQDLSTNELCSEQTIRKFPETTRPLGTEDTNDWCIICKMFYPETQKLQYILFFFDFEKLVSAHKSLNNPHTCTYILNKSENATLQYFTFCEKALDKTYLLKLNNDSQTSSKRFVINFIN